MIKNAALWMATVVALGACNRHERFPGAYQGVVEYEERDLGFEVGGRVRDIPVERGGAVAAGQVIATLDDTLERAAHEARLGEVDVARSQQELVQAGTRPEEIRIVRAQIDAARSQEALMKKTLERHRYLLEHDASTQSAVDEYESRWKSAIAERQALEHRLKELVEGARVEEVRTAEARTKAASAAATLEERRVEQNTLRALHAGTVLDRHVEPGEVVGPGTPVVTVTDLRRPYADVFVPEGEATAIHAGDAATAWVDAEQQGLTAHVEYVWPRAEFTPRFLFSERERPNLVIRVRIRIEDPDLHLVAGLPVFVRLTRGGAS